MYFPVFSFCILDLYLLLSAFLLSLKFWKLPTPNLVSADSKAHDLLFDPEYSLSPTWRYFWITI